MNRILRTIALLAAASSWSEAQTSHTVLLDDKSSEAEVVSVFSLVPPTGYAPVRVKVKNDAAVERKITIGASSRSDNYRGPDNGLESSFSMTAPANKTTEREFLVPVCGVEEGSDLRLSISGGDRSGSVSFDGGGVQEMAFTVFSKALAEHSLKAINDNARASAKGSGYRREEFAALYDAAMLPADWRGYSGLDVLAISADEWMAVQPGVRSAILQWVKLGGNLDLHAKTGGPALESLGIHVDSILTAERPYPGQRHALGAGMVSAIPWDGKELDGTEVGRYSSAAVKTAQREEYGSALRVLTGQGQDVQPYSAGRNPLMEALGTKDFAAWQVGLILMIFGIVVGPVNLFYFAKAGRRHRLFYTTPLISIIAAVLLLAVIFFQDGIGGKGHRAAVVYLDAAENAAFVHQFQVSRTGVLFGGSFETDEAVVVNMALLPASRWNRLNNASDFGYRSRSEPQNYTVSGNSYAGDWFQSRAEQGQILDAMISTRGRLELKPGSATPVITSTLTAPLARVFYTDAAGKYWSSPGPVTTGATITLVEATPGDFIAWRAEAVAVLPEGQRKRLVTDAPKNFFYASSTDPRAGMVETLGSIRWESDHVFLYGPLR